MTQSRRHKIQRTEDYGPHNQAQPLLVIYPLYFNMVEGGGFEPPKAEPSDLQSDPFGHSGTPPAHINLYQRAIKTVNTPNLCGAPYPSRTDDLLITSQLLYQLS